MVKIKATASVFQTAARIHACLIRAYTARAQSPETTLRAHALLATPEVLATHVCITSSLIHLLVMDEQRVQYGLQISHPYDEMCYVIM